MKKLIPFLERRLDIKNARFLEKDIILHRILLRLMQTSFKEKYAFKGGTCLTKCYLGYYRFSEDLDFTYINQKEFEGKSQKALRKKLSEKINEASEQLVNIAEELGLDFKSDKSDTKYVMLGGSNKFVTFKLWFDPLKGGKEEFIKIQINYLDLIINKIIETEAHSLFSSITKEEMELLHPEFIDLLDDIKIMAYSLTEIFLEKIRAILTRRGTKSRDYIDVYLIEKKAQIDITKEESNIIKKIEFMLRYDKYLQNLSVIKPEKLIIGEEAHLLLEPLDDGFKKFLPDFFEHLKKLEEKIKTKSNH
ncbi:MAG: nucleotidyl transferase AbiEii/AbiGii toxin family protein [Nanoarchaeota archaeon]|nr:nucleotidyl transferase AbiEii/AbiGii toxin family protein [Nanoarchaeota archaeon]